VKDVPEETVSAALDKNHFFSQFSLINPEGLREKMRCFQFNRLVVAIENLKIKAREKWVELCGQLKNI
jgi:hypothetical protein